jgi:hypothetical protein
MGFNSTTGSEAGKISKRGKSLNIDLRNDLKTLITHILKDLDYNTLSDTQKLRLLDIAVVGEYYELNGLNYLIVDDSNFNPLGNFLLCTTLVTNMFDSFKPTMEFPQSPSCLPLKFHRQWHLL